MSDSVWNIQRRNDGGTTRKEKPSSVDFYLSNLALNDVGTSKKGDGSRFASLRHSETSDSQVPRKFKSASGDNNIQEKDSFTTNNQNLKFRVYDPSRSQGPICNLCCNDDGLMDCVNFVQKFANDCGIQKSDGEHGYWHLNDGSCLVLWKTDDATDFVLEYQLCERSDLDQQPRKFFDFSRIFTGRPPKILSSEGRVRVEASNEEEFLEHVRFQSIPLSPSIGIVTSVYSRLTLSETSAIIRFWIEKYHEVFSMASVSHFEWNFRTRDQMGYVIIYRALSFEKVQGKPSNSSAASPRLVVEVHSLFGSDDEVFAFFRSLKSSLDCLTYDKAVEVLNSVNSAVKPRQRAFPYTGMNTDMKQRAYKASLVRLNSEYEDERSQALDTLRLLSYDESFVIHMSDAYREVRLVVKKIFEIDSKILGDDSTELRSVRFILNQRGTEPELVYLGYAAELYRNLSKCKSIVEENVSESISFLCKFLSRGAYYSRLICVDFATALLQILNTIDVPVTDEVRTSILSDLVLKDAANSQLQHIHQQIFDSLNANV